MSESFEERLDAAVESFGKGSLSLGIADMLWALKALAAERAEARRAAALDKLAEVDAEEIVLPVVTAYDRAMGQNRIGGQHPHDGRHIMSIGSWGMH